MSPPPSDATVHPLNVTKSSRLAGFYSLSPEERRARLVEARWASPEDVAQLEAPGLNEADADAMVENTVGLHALPLGLGLNFQVNGEDRLLPMSVEEPSVVAACSYAAKLARAGGGFRARADEPVMIAQVQLVEVPNLDAAVTALRQHTQELLDAADAVAPAMRQRGGGARGLEVRTLASDMLCVHVLFDCRDAMGANTLNAIAEALAPRMAELARARFGLRILSNLTVHRKVYIEVSVPALALATEHATGEEVVDAIVAAQRFAELDPYRAVTHNKGIMNGVDAVLLATGNDWRAVEAGAHAYAARDGDYRPLTRWWKETVGFGKGALQTVLKGELEMPLATSVVGGAARNHPGVRRALKLSGATSATDLALLAGCAGLSSNLAALKALATEGIQRGHMSLHARRVAAEAGAQGALIDLVAARLSAEQSYRPERAREILTELQVGRTG